MHVTDYYARPKTAKFGGVNTSRAELVKNFRKYTSFEITVIDAKNGYESEEIVGVNRIELKHFFNHHALMIPRRISRILKESDFLIMHEGWNVGNVYVAILCKFYEIPYFLIPHGVYDPGIVSGLRFKSLRKKVESFVINGAKFVNIFFPIEQEHLSAITKKARTIIAPTGSSRLWENYKWSGDGNYVYFAGRLDVKHKGLDILLKAWTEIPSPYILILQGQDFFGGIDQINTMITELELSGRVLVLPHASHDEIMRKIESCIFFAHISRWEAYGRSVVDALSIGTPTLISESMNLATTYEAKSVFEVVELQHQAVLDGINNLLNRHKSAQDVSFQRINWIRENFDWEKTIAKLSFAMKKHS